MKEKCKFKSRRNLKYLNVPVIAFVPICEFHDRDEEGAGPEDPAAAPDPGAKGEGDRDSGDHLSQESYRYLRPL